MKKNNAQYLVFLATLIFASLGEMLEILLGIGIIGNTLFIVAFWSLYVSYIDDKADRRMSFFELAAVQTFAFVVFFASTSIIEGIINGLLGL